MKTHFHNQEAELLKNTSKRTFISIALIATFLAFAYTNSYASPILTKSELSKCSTIKVQYIKNELIETDSIDEYTLNLSKQDAVKKALDNSLGRNYEFGNQKGNCTISINLGQVN